jgi:putative RecB family exonuclease
MATALTLSPGDVAEHLTGRKYLSYSSISLFQACPLRWFFKNVAGLPEETVAASLVFGSAIHSALQRHFEALMAGNPPPPLEELLAAYRQAWRARSTKEIVFNAGDTAATLTDLASRMLQGFQKSDLARPAGTIVGVEEELIGDLIPGCPSLLARLDLVVETKDEIVVRDFKTSRSRWSIGQAEVSATQLLLYQQLAQSFGEGKRVRLQFAVLTKTKQPVVEIHAVANDPHRIARVYAIVERVWNAMLAGNVYPNPSPANCGTCPFKKPCAAWNG